MLKLAEKIADEILIITQILIVSALLKGKQNKLSNNARKLL